MTAGISGLQSHPIMLGRANREIRASAVSGARRGRLHEIAYWFSFWVPVSPVGGPSGVPVSLVAKPAGGASRISSLPSGTISGRAWKRTVWQLPAPWGIAMRQTTRASIGRS